MDRILAGDILGSKAFTFVMALSPQPPQLPGSPSDKVQHVLAFAVLGGLGSVAYRSTSVVGLLAGLSALGALTECLQTIPALNRDSDLVDRIADTVAAALVLGSIRCGGASMKGAEIRPCRPY